MAERFDFHGFSSLKAYEKECARCGFKTRRVPMQKDGEPYFVFILTSPTGNGVETWDLFRSEFENPIMDGVSGLIAPNDWIETLSLFGFCPCEKGA